MGGFPQISPGVDIERLSLLSQTSPFQYGGNTDDDLCQQHVDTDAEAREDDQDNAKKDASPDCTNGKKIQAKKNKKRPKKKRAPKKWTKKMKKVRLTRGLMKAQSKIQKKDQDSDVSFQEDADEEIDATENEEDWFEYIKRSTKEADENMKNTM